MQDRILPSRGWRLELPYAYLVRTSLIQRWRLHGTSFDQGELARGGINGSIYVSTLTT